MKPTLPVTSTLCRHEQFLYCLLITMAYTYAVIMKITGTIIHKWNIVAGGLNEISKERFFLDYNDSMIQD
jgi:hypothetical protein